MSIAMSLQIRPSSAGFWCMAATSTGLVLVGVVAFLQFLLRPGSIAAFGVICCAGICTGIALAVFAFICRLHQMKSRARFALTLDISARGDMRLLDGGAYGTPGVMGNILSNRVQVMAGSTLWPFFILLRLRDADKKMTVLPIFLYSLTPESFRRLSVACRWIAARTRITASADDNRSLGDHHVRG